MLRIFCILFFIFHAFAGTPAQAQAPLERVQHFDPSLAPARLHVQMQLQGLQWNQADLLTHSARAAGLQREWMVLSAQLSFVALAFIAALFQWLHTGRAIYLGLIGVNALFMFYRLNLGGFLSDAWGQSVPGFVAPRGLVMLSALLLTFGVLLQTAYPRCTAWLDRNRHDRPRALGAVVVVACVLLAGAGALVLLGLFTPSGLFSTSPDLGQLGWPVLCTLLFMTLVRRHHQEAALQQTALAVSAERLRAEVARSSTQQHLLAMLVHEIRAPLAVVELGNRALTQRVLDAAQKAAWAQRMHGAIDTIGQIVENCGLVDRLEAGALAVVADDVAIAPVLSETLDRLRHTVPGATERIQTVYAPETLIFASCRADRRCLVTILSNLLANALKYAPAGSAVLLQCSAVQRGGRACVEFAVHNDQGPSGPPDPARVFERHYHAQTATQVAGTGLGLWLSQNLARQMNSEIHLAVADSTIVFSFALEQEAV